MSSPKNIQRDGIYIEPKTADEINWPTAVALNSAAFQANAKTAIHTDYAQAFTRAAATANADEIELIGVYFQEPGGTYGERVPYRVIADMVHVGQSGTIDNACVVIGYGPASPTGANDLIDEPYIIPFNQSRFDDLIIVPPLDSGDSNYGNPLFFGVGFMTSNAIAGLTTPAHISVQCLGIKPPTMQNAIS